MKLKKSKTKKEVEAILFAISIMLRTRITPFIHYQSFSRIDQFIFENVSCFGIALPSFYFQLAAWYLIDMTAFWLFFFYSVGSILITEYLMSYTHLLVSLVHGLDCY